MKKLFRRLFPNKEQRAFKKMHRSHRKELVKHAKETGEWDWGWLHDSVIMQIRHMYEFYTEGNNVWQVDESRLEIIGQLKHVLDLNDELNHLWDDHISETVTNKDGSITVTDEICENVKQTFDREQELYEEIYSYIGKYIQWWWD